MNEEELARIQAMADAQMGIKREAGAQAAVGAAAEAAAAAAKATEVASESKPTTGEAAVAAASPTTAGDAAAADPVTYEVKMADGSTRRLSSDQIAATYARYANLNMRHSQFKPIIGVLEELMEKTGKGPEDIQRLVAMGLQQLSMQAKPGNNGKLTEGQKETEIPGTAQTGSEMEEELRKWEEDNGIELPKGIRQSLSLVTSLQNQLVQMQQAVQQLAGQRDGATAAAAAATEGAKQTLGQAMKRQIANNLNMIQQQFNLPDDAAQEFMGFAFQRGYTMEDFIDPEMAVTVAQDYVNMRQSAEYPRMRAILERRAAAAGSMGSSPSTAAPAAAAAAAEVNGVDPSLARLAEAGISRKAQFNLR